MAKKKRNYIISAKNFFGATKSNTLAQKSSNQNSQLIKPKNKLSKKESFELFDQVEKLGIDHKDLVDPHRRRFLISTINASTSLTAEAKFGIISSIVAFFAPKEAIAQFVPFAFWKNQGPTIPPTYTFGSLTIYSWGTGSSGAHDRNNTTHYSSPIQISGQFTKAFVGYGNRFLINDQSQCYVVGENGGGKLGLNSTNDRRTKVQLTGSWAQITGGHTQSIGIRTDGSLWAWGGNANGQLGQNNLINRSSPVQVGSDSDWSTVGASIGFTSFAIKQDGSLWAWGRGDYGQHGQSDAINRSSPVQILGSWKAVEGAWQTAIAIRADDTLWVWGNNGSGKLGIGGGGNQSSPVQVGSYNWQKVAATEHSHFGLREDNTLWSWGYNGNGELGDGTTTYRNSPVQVDGVWTDIAAGGKTVGGVKSDGTLWCWGSFVNGNLGESVTSNQSSPIQIGSDTDWTGVEVCAIDFANTVVGIKGEVQTSGSLINTINSTPGTLWAWGRNNYGQLGTNNNTAYSSPVQVSSDYWIYIAGGNYGSVALRSDGTLWEAGTGAELGNEYATPQNSFKQVGGTWKMINTGGRTTLAIASDNTLWAWGHNYFGKVGNDDTANTSSPIQIDSGNWKFVDSGKQHFNAAIKSDGTLWMWGRGYYGALAQETNQNDYSSPVQVGSDSDWALSATGLRHAFGIKENGTLWTWGYNISGMLGTGNGSTYNVSSPVQIPGNWKKVSSDQHTLALKMDGTLWVWGDGSNNKLGTGSTANVSSPVQLTSYKFTHVMARADQSMAIREDGTLWAWGDNAFGQMGNESTTDLTTPTMVNTDNDWLMLHASNDAIIAIKSVTQGGGGGATLGAPQQLLAIPGYLYVNGRGTSGRLGLDSTSYESSPTRLPGLWRTARGDDHSIAIRDDYSLWTWGSNSHGQIGTNNTNNVSSPVQIAGVWLACTTDVYTSFAIRNDNTLWAWGQNTLGRLGTGNTTNSSSPVQVGGYWNFVENGFGIKTDGTLWAWGTGYRGRLGQVNNTDAQSSPVQIGSATDWIAVSCDNATAMALKSDYTLWSWGSNEFGQIGDGTVNHRSSPVQISGSFIQFASGRNSNAAIKVDGTLWVWGRGQNGALGQITNLNNASSPVQIPGSWLQIEGSHEFFRAVKNDGTLWAWGDNWAGQLGDGSTSDRSSPVQVGSENDWLHTNDGRHHSLGIRYATPQKPYTLWTWGYNNAGGLGHGDFTWRSSPVQVPGEWLKVSAGLEHGLGIQEGGTLYAWGWGSQGALGLGNTGNATSPENVPGEWRDISAGGGRFSIGIKSDGTLWGWGDNDNGQSGINTNTNASSPVQIGSENTWKKIVSTGGSWHHGAIKHDGTLWTWGAYWDGRLGNGQTQHTSSPVQITGGGAWKTASFSAQSSFAIKADGTLWVWGKNDEGQLGLGNTINYSQPTQQGNFTWKKVHARKDHVIAIRSDDTIWAWGRNSDGQLGQGGTTAYSSPVQISGTATDVGAGRWHSLLIRENGSLWTAGGNQDGELGLGTAGATDETTFKKVGIENDWVQVHPPEYTASFALRDNVAATSYELWTWGRNNYGQLGFNNSNNYSSPTQISGGKFWQEASGGYVSSLGVRTDGTLWAWGRNNQGQLGIGTAGATSLSSPVQVGADTNWQQIMMTGSGNSFAIKTDGTLWSWGINTQGSLGHGDTNNRSSPVQVGTDTDWQDIGGCGYYHSAMIKTDGTLWTWGQGTHGAHGLGNTSHYSTPQQVGILTDWAQVATGSHFCFAVKTDGTLWSWGRSDQGVLGQNSTNQVNSPVQVGLDTNWKSVSAGWFNSILLRTDGTIWGTGPNWESVLGTNGNSSSPVQIGADSDWAQAIITQQTAFAIKTDGTLWGWGHATDGRLGDNTTANKNSPVLLSSDTDWHKLQRSSTNYSGIFAFKKKKIE